MKPMSWAFAPVDLGRASPMLIGQKPQMSWIFTWPAQPLGVQANRLGRSFVTLADAPGVLLEATARQTVGVTTERIST